MVTRFGVASPLLFVLFVVLFEGSAGGNSGPGRYVGVEQQCGLPRVARRGSDDFPTAGVAFYSYHSIGQYSPCIFKSAHLHHLTPAVSQPRGGMENHAQSVSRRRSFSLPCPGYDLYPRGGIFNVRGSNHVVGFVTLEPSLLVGSLAAATEQVCTRLT